MDGARKWAGSIAVAALMLAAMGMGVSAMFTDQGVATQEVGVGTFEFALDSSTPGASVSGDTLTCPTFTITSAYDPEESGAAQPTCNIQVEQVGTIDTAKVSVYMQVSGDADLSKFRVTPSGSSWYVMPPGHAASYGLAGYTGAPDVGGTAGMIGQWAGAMPASIDMPIAWSELDNGDLGDSFTVSYTLFIYE
jgi:hypothetical protein